MVLVEILLKEEDDEFLSFTDWQSFMPVPFIKSTRLTHVNFPGKIVVRKNPDHDRLFLAKVECDEDEAKEWQILHAFIGRIADRTRENLESIQIFFQ